ncbi:hypothetical protein MNBD_CHLOROFLEXI01-4451 [hydrothermal vent metagenome]|uniref:Uncharacterized protein n=1 Tax=hydrothermal vent metagenome TaxID=652676 RepID=A0A3B0V3A3_9ZZZZ
MIGNILIWTTLLQSKQCQIINLLEEKFHITSDFSNAFPWTKRKRNRTYNLTWASQNQKGFYQRLRRFTRFSNLFNLRNL